MMSQQGPRQRIIPEQRFEVCNGCEFLKISSGLRSHFEHRDSYGCAHTDAGEMRETSGIFGFKLNGTRVIATNIAGPCHTPSWCPFKKNRGHEG